MKSRIVSLFAAFTLVGVACGQYPGVHEQTWGAPGQAAPAGASGGIAAPGATPGAGLPGTTGTTAGGTTATGAGTTGGTTTTTGGTPTTGGGTPNTGGGTSAPTGGTTTGVTPTSIKIGLHAPITGAAPFEQTSFSTGKDLYWENGTNGRRVEIHGRTVEIVVEDDQYRPSTAIDKCQKMAEQDQVFLLIGGGGTDQVQACAQYAASQGIPYLSAGVTELNLDQLPNYFALSMSYAQQVPLLAQFIRKNRQRLGWNGDQARIAMVVTNTPNFEDAVSAFQQQFPQAAILRHEKNERGGTMAGRLCAGTVKNYDVVFPLTAPIYYLEMAGSARCNPQYVGVGITMGLDQVAANGCRAGQSTEGAYFFSPAPAFADSNKYEPAFRQAGGSDDIMFLLWGLSKALHQLFEQAGRNLTREGFIQSTSQATVRTGVFPDLRYTPSDHFGANQVHLLRNVCSGGGGHYVTDKAFVSRF